jgi:uncharacterized LabA/DUF88 family protein
MKKRLICLIDGENLVIRYQEMLASGRVPHEDNFHLPDVCVWNNRLLGLPIDYDVIRATYYSSVFGDAVRARDVRDEVQTQMYACGDERTYVWQRLSGVVFAKSQRARKTKIVDMRVCIDALANTMNRNMEVLYLVAGDGDYVPLVEEIMRHGVRVCVFALSDGLAEQMRSVGDQFSLLDDKLFKQ